MTTRTGERRLRRTAAQDVLGKLKTQSGPRTAAPMWVRPLLTSGEWDVYTALWSYPSGSVFPTHQHLADRAWCERGTAADAVARFEELGLLAREPRVRDDGSHTSNEYYLLEVPTEQHLARVAELTAERKAVQEAKRRKRKAKNRTYTAKSGRDGVPAGGTAQEVPPAKGGTAQEVPPGYGADRTSGGTAHAVPGYGAGRTHEPLGVDVVVKGTVRTASSSPDDGAAPVEPATAAVGDREEDWIPSEHQHQEQPDPETDVYVKSDMHWPTLTEDEQALLDEVVRVQPLWEGQRRMLRKVLGSRTIRDIALRDPDLVRRAFLIGARDPGTLPMRMWWVAQCPHWRRAAAELLAEQREPARPAKQPASDGQQMVPVQPTPGRGPAAPVSPAAPTAEYLAWKKHNAEQVAARQRAAQEAEEERRKLRAEMLAEFGVTV